MIDSSPWLPELETLIGRVRESAEPEDVHQLRVASRRLASWLRLGGLHVLRDDLRWLRAVAGRVRDVDVVLELEGDPSWNRWLRSERRVRHQALHITLGAERTAALLQAMHSLPAVPRDQARGRLPRLAGKALAAGEALEAAPEDAERFHELRRKVRVVRYALEWLGDKTGAFREFQELSGLAADRALTLRLLAIYPQLDELAARRSELEAEYADRRREALEAWPALRERVREVK